MCLTPTTQVYTQFIPSAKENFGVHQIGEVLERSLLLLATTSYNPIHKG